MGVEYAAIRHDNRHIFWLGKGAFPRSYLDSGSLLCIHRLRIPRDCWYLWLRRYALDLFWLWASVEPAYREWFAQRFACWAYRSPGDSVQIEYADDCSGRLHELREQGYQVTASRYTEDWHFSGGAWWFDTLAYSKA